MTIVAKDVLDIISATADGAFAIDARGRIVMWNKAAEKILGFKSDEVVGKHCFEIVSGRDQYENMFCFQDCQVMRLAKKSEPIRNYDLLMKGKNGKSVWTNVSVMIIPGAKRNLFTMIHLFREIEQREQLEKLVRQLMDLREDLPWPEKEPDGDQGNSTVAPPPRLTTRELEVLKLTAKGLDPQAIAEQLYISPATVRNHTQNILMKLGVHSKLEAVVYAYQNHLI